MKKILAVVLSVVAYCAIFSGCKSKTEKFETTKLDERFLLITDTNNGTGFRTIIVDKETGVMYLFVGNGYRGGLTIMVDAEGKPLVYDGEYGE